MNLLFNAKKPLLVLGLFAFWISLVVTMGLNRWGNLIPTPVSGLYLVDALLLVAVITAVWCLISSKPRRGKIWVPWLVVGAYFLVVLLPELLTVNSERRYLAVRDVAPFGYLLTVPFIAALLTLATTRSLIWAVRLIGVLAAVVALTRDLMMGQLNAWVSSSVSIPSVVVPYADREDLAAAAVAVGVVAWGSWEATGGRTFRSIQITLIGVAALTTSSRAGLIAVLAAVLVVFFRSSKRLPALLGSLGAVSAFALGIGLQGLATQVDPIGGVPTSQTSAASPDEIPKTAPDEIPKTAPDETQLKRDLLTIIPLDLLSLGTVVARLDTWSDVIVGMTQDGSWLVGGSAGSDYLYQLCTGMRIAPAEVLAGEKCSVDDRGPGPITRDPHNWILNITVIHGLLGLLVFAFAVAWPLVACRRDSDSLLPSLGALIYLSVGLFFPIGAGYAMIPIVFFLSWRSVSCLSDVKLCDELGD